MAAKDDWNEVHIYLEREHTMLLSVAILALERAILLTAGGTPDDDLLESMIGAMPARMVPKIEELKDRIRLAILEQVEGVESIVVDGHQFITREKKESE